MRIAQSQASRLPSAIIVISALALALSANAGAHEITKAAPGSTYKALRGLGPAKGAGNGLLRVKLENDDTVLTHGPDAEPAAENGAGATAAAGETPAVSGPERQPVCASDYYQHVLYGYPADRASRFSSVKATILGEIKRMDAVLDEEALASGGRNADYKVKCDSAGEIRVDTFRSAQTDAQTTFSGVLSSARSAGFKLPNVDYTIFFDSAAPPACGTGTFSPDQRLTAGNENNAGGDYGVVYSNCWTDRTAMHENGHNQGAVQYDAPFSTGNGAHCNDGYDVMCYSDGGDKDVGMSVFCRDRIRFDCRHDTYFDTAPEPGEYLASNWNLGSSLNRFVAFDVAGQVDVSGEVGPPPPSAANVPGSVYQPSAPAAAAAAPAAPRSLPTLSMAAARRYARSRIKHKHARARGIRARCSRRSRTSATCRVRWSVAARAYSGRMVVSYRLRDGQAALAASSTVRRIR